MHVIRSLSLATVMTVFTVADGMAHHGKDFLIVESYDVPHPGDLYFVSSVALADSEGGTGVELEPSLLVGVFPRVAFELHSHIIRDPHEAVAYEATAPSLHLQLTPPDSDFPVRVGLSGEYEFAAHSSSHDRAEGRLILESAVGRSRFAFNIVGEHERAGNSTVGYAAGYRYEFTHALAYGVETQGPFTHGNNHEVVAAIYGEPTEGLTLKVGVGAEIASSRADPVARFGVVWRF